MTALVIIAIIFFYILMYGGTIFCGGIGFWLFVKSLKTRDEQKCIAIAVIVGLVFYGILVAIPGWIFQIQLERMPGPPMQKFEALTDTPLGKFMTFSTFFGTGLSILFAGMASGFAPTAEKIRKEAAFQSLNDVQQTPDVGVH